MAQETNQSFNVLENLMRAYTKFEILRIANGTDQAFFDSPPSKLFGQVCQRAMGSTPYEIDISAREILLTLTDEDADTLADNLHLPFTRTWLTFPKSDAREEVGVGVILHEKGNGTISGIVCVEQEIVDQDQPNLSFPEPLRTKLSNLRGGSLFLIFPEATIITAGKLFTSEFPNNSKPLIYTDKKDFTITLGYPAKVEAQWLEDVQAILNTALIWSGLITKKSQIFPTIIGQPRPPSLGNNRLLLRLGKSPRVPSGYVNIDIDRIKVRTPNPDSAAPQKKIRHWVGSYTYFKPSLGRHVNVPEHERYIDSSPTSAAKKPRQVKANGGPIIV